MLVVACPHCGLTPCTCPRRGSRATLAALGAFLPREILDATPGRRLLAAIPTLAARALVATLPHVSPELGADLENADPATVLAAAVALASDRGEALPLASWLAEIRPGNPGKSADGRRRDHTVTLGDAAWNRLQAEARRRGVSVSDLVEELGLSLPTAVVV